MPANILTPMALKVNSKRLHPGIQLQHHGISHAILRTEMMLLANPDSHFSPQITIYIMGHEFSSQLSALSTYGT
jgi:hypothetical protein